MKRRRTHLCSKRRIWDRFNIFEREIILETLNYRKVYSRKKFEELPKGLKRKLCG